MHLLTHSFLSVCTYSYIYVLSKYTVKIICFKSKPILIYSKKTNTNLGLLEYLVFFSRAASLTVLSA
jgi:hypothetical protein